MPINNVAGSLSVNGFKANTLQIGSALYNQIQIIKLGRQRNVSLSKDGIWLGLGGSMSTSSRGGSGYIYKWDGTEYVQTQTFFSSTVPGYACFFAFNSDATIMAMQTQGGNQSPAVSAKVGFFTRSIGSNTFSLQYEVTLPSTSTTKPTPITSMEFSSNGDYLIINCKEIYFAGFENAYIYGLTAPNTWSLQLQRSGVESGVSITDNGDIAVFGGDLIYTRSGSTWSSWGSTPGGITISQKPISISGDGEYILNDNEVYYPALNWSNSSVISGYAGGSERVMSKDSNYILEPTVYRWMTERTGNTWNYYDSIGSVPNQLLGFSSEYIRSAAIDGTGDVFVLNNNTPDAVGYYNNFIFKKV